VDTGGLLGNTHEWSQDIHKQALGAISEADLIIYVLGKYNRIRLTHSFFLFHFHPQLSIFSLPSFSLSILIIDY
jgi:GTPase Era involved in 16S rRNA processing